MMRSDGRMIKEKWKSGGGVMRSDGGVMEE